MTDETILKEIAKNDHESIVRTTAIRRLRKLGYKYF